MFIDGKDRFDPGDLGYLYPCPCGPGASLTTSIRCSESPPTLQSGLALVVPCIWRGPLQLGGLYDDIKGVVITVSEIG